MTSLVLCVFITICFSCSISVKPLQWSTNNSFITLSEPLAGVSYGLTSDNNILYIFASTKGLFHGVNSTILTGWTITDSNNDKYISYWDSSNYLQTPNNAPIYCYSHCTVTINNQIYIIGQESQIFYKFDTATKNWILDLGNYYNQVPESCVVTDNKQIFVYSGYYLQTYDISTDSWLIDSVRDEHQLFGSACVYHKNTKSIFIFGGKVMQDRSYNDNYFISNKILKVGTKYNTWNRMKSRLNFTRYGSSAVLFDNKIYIIGGVSQDENLTEYSVNAVDIYNPVDDTLITANPMNYNRSYPIIFINNSRIYICGGEGNDSVWSNCEVSSSLANNETTKSKSIIIYAVSISSLLLILILVAVFVVYRIRKRSKFKQIIDSRQTNLLLHGTDESTFDYVSLEETKQTSDNVCYTKHNGYGVLILCCCLLFCIFWILWIIYNISKNGIYARYCNNGDALCQEFKGTETLSPFIIQMLLICVIMYNIYLLIKALIYGIQIQTIDENENQHENSSNKIVKNLKKFKQYIHSKRVDCRKYIYEEKYDTTKSTVSFLYRSIFLLNVFKLIQHLPAVILNVTSSDKYLRYIGLFTFGGDVVTVLATWQAQKKQKKYHCGCKKCDDQHFPLHHRLYSSVAGSLIMVSVVFKIFPAQAQINFLSYVRPTDEYHSWLKCVNFIMAVNSIISGIKLYWVFYYLLCFYWSRYAVNKYEHKKMKSILGSLLVGIYGICKISINENDEFVTVDDNEKVAKKVDIKFDCFAFCTIYVCSTLSLMWIAVVLLNATSELNNAYAGSYDYGVWSLILQ